MTCSIRSDLAQFTAQPVINGRRQFSEYQRTRWRMFKTTVPEWALALATNPPETATDARVRWEFLKVCGAQTAHWFAAPAGGTDRVVPVQEVLCCSCCSVQTEVLLGRLLVRLRYCAKLTSTLPTPCSLGQVPIGQVCVSKSARTKQHYSLMGPAKTSCTSNGLRHTPLLCV